MSTKRRGVVKLDVDKLYWN